MYILGINMSHDRSACLLKDGIILFAIAEERLDRDKKSIGYMQNTWERMIPLRSITYCLDSANINIDDLDLIVVDHAMHPVDIIDFKKKIPIKNKTKIRSLPHPSHHLAHAYSTFFCSPFNESAILVADVFGSETFKGNEGESGFYAAGNKLKPVFKNYQLIGPKIPKNKHYYSLTYIYSFITRVLGYGMPYGSIPPEKQLDEAGKTMALASFGKHINGWPPIIEEHGNILKTNKFTQWVLENKIAKIKDNELIPLIKFNSSKKINQFQKNLAFKAQKEFEKGLIWFANRLYYETKSENLCIAGGAGLNCVANRKILKNTPFKNIFIQPAATDDGNAIGCAMYGWHKIAKSKKRFYLKNVYLGKKYSDREIKAALTKYNISLKPLSKKDIIKQTAKFISRKKIIGWFQGKAEFGPRALGHRSILADPRYFKMKELINKKVKHRESFRPYAPSILLEFANLYFDLPHPSPFMLLVAKIKKEKLNEIPAVSHIDGTARVQTVTKTDNDIFYDLIKEFYRITKIPIVLNTSFNIRGEPIVETPENALNVFFNTEMDILILQNYLLEKESKEIKEAIEFSKVFPKGME